MPQHNVPESVYREGRVVLTISALKRNQFQSMRHAAATYNVDDHTLRRRRAGIQSQRNCKANSKKLTKLKELAIVQHILDLNSQGFAPKLIYVKEMANQLLAAQSTSFASQVSINWPTSFIQ